MTYAQMSVPSAQNSQKVSVTVASAQSTAFQCSNVLVTVSALCFVVVGVNPTAVADTSMALAPNIPYRLCGIKPGEKLAFITATGTADAYITPDA